VSVFAAGCAICGTDLVLHRRELEERRIEPPHVPRAARRSGLHLDAHFVLVALVLLATLLSPFVALIMAAVGAQDRHRNGQIGQRNLFIGLAVANLALAFLPELRFGLYSLLY
jgi:sterol desaturase/sphingolipid hydroxylase (fatty acid hydroxylase superfamily)